ncbi:Hypothetical protein NTJ_02807 [Nesidiocoris tenuis]|uniref:Uncharacterized protein n=1 Tax=Nesidiocoris tenuis TaxID=355587 RepID=A0ABN7AFQ7_9HEMI|nr:Hypothetical protein NTJ_02807 [Nesidiocoris tenuis]
MELFHCLIGVREDERRSHVFRKRKRKEMIGISDSNKDSLPALFLRLVRHSPPDPLSSSRSRIALPASLSAHPPTGLNPDLKSSRKA